MDTSIPQYLCLSELLDQDLSAYEYFQTLPPEIQSALGREEDSLTSFQQLQSAAARLRDAGAVEW